MGWKKVKGKNYETRDIQIPEEPKKKVTFMDFIYSLVGWVVFLSLIGWLTKPPSKRKNYKQFYE